MNRRRLHAEDEGPLAGFLPMVDCYAAIAIVFMAKWATSTVQEKRSQLPAPQVAVAAATQAAVTLPDAEIIRLELRPGGLLARLDASPITALPIAEVLRSLPAHRACLLSLGAGVPAAEMVHAIAAFHGSGQPLHLMQPTLTQP